LAAAHELTGESLDPIEPEGWPRTLAQARVVQEAVAARVIRRGHLGDVRRIVAVDAHHGEASGLSWAAVAETDTELSLSRSVMACRRTTFPYVSGFLSFREAPAILAALSLLPDRPDLLVVDGQGLAHPRRLGIACHIGVLADLPTIGIAKSVLVGRFDEPGPDRSDWTPMVHRGEVVGAAVRTRAGARPVYVSIGHRIDLETAIDWTLRITPTYRLAEPIRLADRISRMHPG
jgi:deoxyribonuclease V